ncbi:beta strand repeat-containing protein [Candidatus Thiodubiliella endoseptemdiera]|uniref:beta strand repeat-containing protein n=1 Tax=Candidatus Thiodubiliella endoseptemdiera TaxID=2738886 RepID=UPI0034DF3D8F
MPGQTKYFISNTNGFFVNWYSDITGLESHGQALKVSGNSGDDAVYVGQGTKVDATGLTSTGGNDSIYLTGTFNNYEQTLDGNTYTFKRTVTINDTEYQEEVSFTASNGDKVYFANGFFKIDIAGNDGLSNAGVFQKIKSTDIDSSSSTPTDPLTSQPAIDKGGATKVFISDNNGEHITPGVKGSVFKISGNSGNDTVYVAQGTKVDATGLTSTGGNDVVYLTGTFNNYEQTLDGITYTFKRTVNINSTDYQEEVSFTASNGDRVYFADGFVKIDITGDDGLSEAGAFKRIISTDIDGSESTPGLGIGLSITDDLAETSIINKAKVGTDITYTFTFKDDVTGFDKTDIEVTGGTKGAFSGSGSVYSLVVRVTDNSTTDLFVGVAKDAAIGGSIGTEYASNSHKVDTVVPSKPISLDLATEDDSGTSNSDNLTNKTSNLTITGSAEVGATIRLYNGTNTTAIGSETVKANGTFSIDISLTQSTTPHSITARATDVAGNESLVSDALAITVDTTTATLTAQAMSVILGEDSNLVIDFSENIKAGTGNIVIHKASDNTIVETIAIDNSKISIANDKLTINPTADLTEGTYYIKMASGVITDMAGNVFAGITNLGADTTWAFKTKALFTTVMVEGLNDGYINYSEKSTVEISGVITSGGDNPTINKVEFFKDGSSDAIKTINNVSVDNNKIWKIENNELVALNLDDGSYTLKITLADGGTSVTSIFPTSGSIIIDTLAPTALNVTATLISNTDSDITVTSTDSSVGYLVHNSLSGDAINTVAKLEALVAGNKVNKVTGLGGDARSFNPHDLIEGTYNWYLADQAGNISAESNDVVMDNTAPILTTQASAELGETSDLILDFNEDIQAGSTGSIVIKGSDDGVIATINITETTKFSIAGDKLTIDVSALGLTDNKLTQGSYYITMDAGTVTDIAGNGAAAITKDTNQWAFEIIVLTTDIVWAGADDNYINNNEKDATTLSGKATGIGTLTITKIEFFEGSNTVGTAITSGLPAVAADGTWTLAHSAMPSELADGKTYTAVVTLSDGTNSTISTSTAVTYDTINPTPITTNPWTLSNIPAGQSAFKVGDVISLTLTMSETLKLNNTTGSKVVIAGKDFVLDKTASTTVGDKKLVFKYSVQAGDSIAATDFDIDNPTSDITLNNITDVAGNAPVFTADRVVLAKTKLEYIEKTGSGNNPFEGIDVGNASAPTLADIDSDGDLDLVVGEENRTLKYYQNTGTTSNPAYEAKTGDSNLFNGIDVGGFATPTLADIDGDGDLDLVVGENNGTLKYYQNTGTTSNPAYEAKTGDDNPFNGINAGYSYSPILVDIDGDGDLDLVMGEAYGTLKYYQNTGTTSNPAYEAKTGDDNPFNSIDVGDSSKPTLADIDGDGDLDLVVGESDGTLKYYQNTGTTSNPAYEAKTGDDNPFNGIDVGRYSAPVLADIDGDGDLDLVVGEQNGTLKYYYNQQPSSVDTQAPTPITTNPWVLSDIPAGQSAFKTGDVISLTLTMSETLKLNNTTGSKVVIAGKDFVLDKTASITAGDKKLVFKYSVQAGDSIAATDFDIDNPTSDITLNNITNVAGNAPVFTADRVVLAKTKLEYIEKTGLGNNPFNGIDVGGYSTPILADIDGDGDLDLVVGEKNRTHKYYQNTGTTSNPAYEAKTGGSNPFNGINAGFFPKPTLADIDGDGDLDLVVGEQNGTLKYYQNTSSTSNPAYEAKTGDSNPFNGIDVGHYSTPNLADIDGDGDLDLVMGEAYGTLKYYQNTGTTSNPAYEVKTGGSNPFNSIDVGDFSAPTLADIDGDGDLDLVVGEFNGTLKYYQNTGTTSNPAYEAKTGDDNPFNGIDVGRYSAPVLADIDGDGDLDLVVGEENGTLKYYYNQQPASVDGQAPTPTATNSWTLSNIPAGQSAFKTGDVISLTLTMSETLKLNNTTGSKVVIAGKDFVLDKTASTTAGDKKLVFKYSVQAGDSIAATDFYIDNPTRDITLNNITDVVGNAPVFTADRVVLTMTKLEYIEKTGSGNNPFEGIDVGDLSAPTLADIDGDGDLDLVVGESDGTLKYYQNTGTTSNPAYEAKTGDDNPFNGIDVGYYSSPTLADIDGDGDLDLVMGEAYGTLKYYQNTGTTSNPAYEAKTGDDNPFNGIDVGDSSKPALADIDGDGDLDLVVGEDKGTLKYYQNTGTTSNPAYEAKTGDDNPFNGIDVGYSSSPTLADIDGDGDLDLVAGEEQNGTLKYYRNTGTTSNPTYEAKTGDSNPFNGIDVGNYSTPNLADIDGDGDLDLVVGEVYGTLKYYNQQPASVDGQAQRPLSVDEQVPTFTEKTSDTNVLGEPSNLVIEFSENIKTNGGIVEIWNSAEKVATIGITNANISDTTLTLNPSNLTSGVYYIKMASGVITDTSGNDFAGIDNTSGKTWAFAYNFYIGTDNADTITGSAGDDTINGGAGNDTINGGSGSDIFVYASTDNGEDTITGFIFGAGGDKLDLKDFITASGNQATLFANIDKYITVSDTDTAGSAKLTIDADGTVTDDVADLVINLQGVSGIGGSPAPDTVALGHFITDNLILV